MGLIIKGMMGVGYNACITPDMARIYDEEFHAKFKEIAETVHRHAKKPVSK